MRSECTECNHVNSYWVLFIVREVISVRSAHKFAARAVGTAVTIRHLSMTTQEDVFGPKLISMGNVAPIYLALASQPPPGEFNAR
jgi:hypothetical protein